MAAASKASIQERAGIGAGGSVAAVIDVGCDKQLFIDHRFIAECRDVELRVNPPVKRPGAIVESGRPWDAFNLIYFSIAEDEGRCKMWYQAFDDDQWAGGGPRLCYAESGDGLSWEKPDLGLVEYQGSRANNILVEYSKLAFVFVDPHGPPGQRFKMLTTGMDGIHPLTGARVGTSADGLRWSVAAENSSNIPGDTQKVAFRDERIGRLEMDEILDPWPDEEVQAVLVADELDPPGSDIYHHLVYRYPHAADAYFMFPFVYQHFREGETDVGNDGVNDTQFCASRDGVHWMRYDRRPYISRGLPGEPDCGLAHATPFVIRRGDLLYHYYTGWPWTHGGFRRLSKADRRDRANWGRGFYGVTVQRLDGFVSVDAPYTGGSILTPPLRFAGACLQLNVDVAAMGELRVELQDEGGAAIEGFGLDDCDRVLFNDVAWTVTWRGRSDLSSLTGRPVRLRIVMRSARLFAFQFAQPESGL